MSQFNSFNSLFGYYGKFQRARGNFGGLPSWARGLVFVAAIPGILLLVLSILLLIVSILALLLLTAPVYGLLHRFTSGGSTGAGVTDLGHSVVVDSGGFGRAGRKQVDATVVKPPQE